MIKVSAYKARTNFGDLLNRVYYGGEEIIIERKGEPMAKLTKITKEKKKKKSIMEFAGILKDVDTDKMIKEIYKARRDGSRYKKYLAKW